MKERPVYQLSMVVDISASFFYIVATQKYKRKVALIHEMNEETPVKHFCFTDKVVKIGLFQNFYKPDKYN